MLSEKIKKRLAERFTAPLPEFHKRRIVFWRDEDGDFADDFGEMSGIVDVTLVKLTGKNNFAVKKLLSEDDIIGNYLIYDPLEYEKDGRDDWLLDIKLYSEEFRADIVSDRMEELLVEPSSAMRKTIKLYAKFLGNQERRAKLKKIGRTYQSPIQLHIDIMAVLCGISGVSAQDLIIAVLSAGLCKESNQCLIAIEKFGNIDAFWSLVYKYTGFENTPEKPLADLAAHILITAMSQAMPAKELKDLERFISDSCKTYCYQLVHEWQHSKDGDVLFEVCRHVEREQRLANLFDKVEINVLLKSDTFPAINESILKHCFEEIGGNVIKVGKILGAVENRRTAGWYGLTADCFESLYYIAKMQEFYLSHIEGFHAVEPTKIWEGYTTDAYLMDTHYRHFHYHFSNALKALSTMLEDALKKCSGVVEGLYQEWFLRGLAQNWTAAISDDLESLGYVSEINKQRDFYRKYVKKNERNFVVVSDALRYEVAAELAETLSQSTKGNASIKSVQAIFPGITKFGMAAMLPGREISVNENMDVFVDGNPTKDTPNRGTVLGITNQNSVTMTYKNFLQMSKQERRDICGGKDVIFIYHNTIDNSGEHDEMRIFDACNSAIGEIKSIVDRIVNDLSGVNIYITADHGFLYTYRPLEETQKISRQSFNGEIYELGRRYALVSPDTTAEYLLPVKTERELGGIPMKGYAPQDNVRIKIQGGGENYVHGGISLQEMVVPVIVYKGMRSSYKEFVEVQNPGLSLISDSRKVSNLIFSLDFLQKEPIGKKIQPCSYTLHFTDDADLTISDSQTVIADRTSDNASERVFRVKFTLKQMAYNRKGLYRLVISDNNGDSEDNEFCIDIAVADDFGFDL